MTAYSKPPVKPAWGETAANPADISVPADGTIQAGWPNSATPPARQYFNWVLNWCANALRYVMQLGVSAWDAAETYQIYGIARGPDNLLYQSLQNANINHTPASSPAWWGPLTAMTPASTAVGNEVATAAFLRNYIKPSKGGAVTWSGATPSWSGAAGVTVANADHSGIFAITINHNLNTTNVVPQVVWFTNGAGNGPEDFYIDTIGVNSFRMNFVRADNSGSDRLPFNINISTF